MDQETIYARHAAEYDALVEAEDCERRLMPAIEAIVDVRGKTVLDVGAGTGRVTRQLAARAARVVGVDRSGAMLAIARRHLEAMKPPASFELHEADARALPVESGFADVAVAGWVFGHFRKWMPEGWRAEVGRALAEMERAVVAGGVMIVIETLGTGRTEPLPPSADLAEYYAWLESEHGMTRQAIRTDYQFRDVESAAAVTGFFFGEAFGERVRREGSPRIPECTGLWSKRARGA